MLGINLLFAGFALTLNGVSYIKPVDNNAKGIANILVGTILAINAIFQTHQATEYFHFGFAAGGWLFALNYIIIGAHTLVKATNWNVFGIYSLFATIVSLVFAVDILMLAGGHLTIMSYMWLMWALLWAQSFFAILLNIKAIDKFTPHILIINGIASTFVPGLLILLGRILL